MESGDRVVSERELGRQGRLLLAFLGTRRAHAVSRAQLIEGLWDRCAPPSVDGALNALISKLRATTRTLGVPPPYGVAIEAGAYQLVIPAAWIDIETARDSLDRAEGALRGGDLGLAWANANVAAAITRQPFLVGADLSWIQHQRKVIGRVWSRASLVLSAVSTRNGELELGIQHAADVLAAEPFEEVACQALMRAHAAAGNRAEALRVYAHCRKLFRDELGAEPSEKTSRVFLEILRAE
jgi:DNA-binding SARP family transcriptional activator